jgi:hypothetical protein
MACPWLVGVSKPEGEGGGEIINPYSKDYMALAVFQSDYSIEQLIPTRRS